MTRAKPLERLTLAIQVSAPAWRRSVPGLATLARETARAAYAAARAAGHAPLGEAVTLRFVDDGESRRLNARFRGKDKPTNVLSFPGAGAGADLVLSHAVIVQEAENQGKSVSAHTRHLIVHGILHLMGYDHGSARDARIMEDAERAVLKGFGLPDPYVLRG